MKRNKKVDFLISAISVVLFLLIWYVCTAVLELLPPRTLPDPITVLTSFIDKLTNKNPDGATLIEHTLSSLRIALTGFGFGVLIGVPLGYLMAWYKPIDHFVTPLFDLLKPIPGVAWIPLMVVIFGLGIESKVAVVFLGCVTPCMLNSYTGIKQTKDVHLWVAQTFGASNFKMLVNIAIPTALPYTMTGIRIALGSAWVSIVAAELLGATKGLGFMIQQARGIYRTDIILVGMVSVGVCGAVLTAILSVIERIAVKGRGKNAR